MQSRKAGQERGRPLNSKSSRHHVLRRATPTSRWASKSAYTGLSLDLPPTGRNHSRDLTYLGKQEVGDSTGVPVRQCAGTLTPYSSLPRLALISFIGAMA